MYKLLMHILGLYIKEESANSEAEWPSGRSGDFPVGRPACEVRWTGPQLCSGLRSQLDRPTVVSGREASASRP